jgi:oligoribonuclease
MVLIWMDLEMTGLEPDRHVIVEIATLVTDDKLEVVATGPELVMTASTAELAQMGEYVTSMHEKSGLLAKIRASTTTRADAEAQTLAFLKEHAESGTVPLAGNSIGTDRRFLQEQMPQLERFFHYRNVDVSTVKELCSRWFPETAGARPDKAVAHRALEDIHESLAELAYYRRTMFVSVEGSGPGARAN